MFCRQEPLLRFKRTGGTLTTIGYRRQYFRDHLFLTRAFALFFSLYALPAWAQNNSAAPSPELDEGKQKIWKELHSRAAEALNNGRTVDAVAAWKAAYEIKPMYYLACDIGTGELMVGNAVEAAQFSSDCLRMMSYPLSKEDQARKPLIENNLKKAKAQIGTLQLTIDESGASIRVDAQSKGLSPISDVFVHPGAHRIIVEKIGYEREEIAVSVGKGEIRSLVVRLRKIPPKPPEPIQIKIPSPPQETPIAKKAPLVPIAKIEKPISAQRARSLKVIKAGIGLTGISGGFAAALWLGSSDWDGGRDEAIQGLHRTDNDDCAPSNAEETCGAFQSNDQTRMQMQSGAILSLSIAGAAGIATLIYGLSPWKGFDFSVGRNGAMVTGTW